MKVKIPVSYKIKDNKVKIIPTNELLNGKKYYIKGTTSLQNQKGFNLKKNFNCNFVTQECEYLNSYLNYSFNEGLIENLNLNVDYNFTKGSTEDLNINCDFFFEDLKIISITNSHQNIIVKFNKTIKKSSITNSTIILKKDSKTINCNLATEDNILIIKPNVKLQNKTKYILELSKIKTLSNVCYNYTKSYLIE